MLCTQNTEQANPTNSITKKPVASSLQSSNTSRTTSTFELFLVICIDCNDLHTPIYPSQQQLKQKLNFEVLYLLETNGIAVAGKERLINTTLKS